MTKLHLTDNGLTGPLPRELGDLTSLRELNLGWNGLTGPIPRELGNLTSLRELNLYSNDLTGPIPSELGRLTSLWHLNLGWNGLTGPIPRELGDLTRLRQLNLSNNGLTGPIPSKIGNLTRLTELGLEENDLTGPIPPELGDLTSLTELGIDGNDLMGPIPPELGDLTRLTDLKFSGNSGLVGSLPTELARLGRLETLLAFGTDLCAPSDPGFQDWLRRIDRLRVATCVGDSSSFAYLTQAVQSQEYPVPLVAGEKALLRVFVTAATSTTAGIPPVRALFYVDGTEIHVADIPARAATLPTEVYEGDLSRSSNAEIPAEIILPGLEMVVEIDPEGTLDPGIMTASRIPDTGRMAVDVREMPVLHLTVIPFLWSADPHRGAVDTAEAMQADPEGHELLFKARTLLPIGDIEVTAHAPVMTSSSPDDPSGLFEETEAIRAMEGGSGHYMGTISSPGHVRGPRGLAGRPGRVSISSLNAATMAHELGHNMSLYHAPCGSAGGPDPAFPYPDGSTGAWGYDFRFGGALATPGRPDLMSYCGPAGISDYHFANALRFRLFDEGSSRPASLIDQEAMSLLLWGGMDAEGQPFLNPSFVVDAPSALPRDTGEHRITGRSGSGGELFSVGFAMPEVADGDGSSSFAFVLPVEPGWAIRLASITLSGPGGSVTLDSDTDTPLFILFDPSTRQVRGILRDLPQAGASALVSQAGANRLDVLFSRGIPDAAAWGQSRILDLKGIGGRQAPPPALMLSVAPSSIDWGANATLTWSSADAESVKVTPDLGAVPASGSRIVSPRTTTTYHITVRGADGQTRTASVTVRVVGSQRDVLTALYQSTGGPDWFDSSNWGTSRPLGDWHGITVDDDGRVTELNLNDNGLTGPIPPELGNLTRLRELILGFNALTGPIPPELGNLANLRELILGYNGLTGPIPPEFGNLTRLVKLRLSSNDLAGPIPPEFGNLTRLTELRLDGNALTGPIPPELGNLTSLRNLQLRSNDLTGPIPPELGNLTRLTSLGLHPNYFTGPIPPELGNLTRLTELRLDGNALTGPIPPEFGNLTRLTELRLDGNALTG
ncbi:MAG: M66 family metalloprotease, partial [Acidobacteriota bacterium]|nr:M66 family metalloprotease [Acidobacteriota bacterium]